MNLVLRTTEEERIRALAFVDKQGSASVLRPEWFTWLLADHKDALAEINRLETRHQRLLELIEPVIALLQQHHRELPDDAPIYRVNDAVLLVGDLRRLAEFVKEKRNVSHL